MSDDVSAEDAQMEILGAAVRQVLDSSPALKNVVASMLSSRQLYSVCVREMDKLLAENLTAVFASFGLTDNPENRDIVRKIIMRSIAVEGQKAFHADLTLKGIQSVTVPWLQLVVERNLEEFKSQKLKAAKEEEEARLSSTINFDLPIEDKAGRGTSHLHRDRSLILIGNERSVKFTMAWLTEKLANKGEVDNVRQAVRLIMKPMADFEQSAWLRITPTHLWLNCLNSQSAWDKLVNLYLADTLSGSPDVCLIDDLLSANTADDDSKYFRHALNAAHIRLRRYNKFSGCLFVLGVPTTLEVTQDSLDEMFAELVDLRRSADIVAVDITDDGDTAGSTVTLKFCRHVVSGLHVGSEFGVKLL